MGTQTMYQFRLDSDEKEQAFQVFNELGIKPAQAMRLFLRQVTATRSIPFEIKVANDNTVRAMEETEQMISARRARFHSAEELFASLEQEAK